MNLLRRSPACISPESQLKVLSCRKGYIMFLHDIIAHMIFVFGQNLIIHFSKEMAFLLLLRQKQPRWYSSITTWQHSGFNVYCGPPVEPWDDEDAERLAQYIVRAPFSQERMTYIPEHESPDGVAKVVYEGKTSGVDETFTAHDWLARLVTHIPGKGEQMVRYYGYYSNKSRGMKKVLLRTGSLRNLQHSCSTKYSKTVYIVCLFQSSMKLVYMKHAEISRES